MGGPQWEPSVFSPPPLENAAGVEYPAPSSLPPRPHCRGTGVLPPNRTRVSRSSSQLHCVLEILIASVLDLGSPQSRGGLLCTVGVVLLFSATRLITPQLDRQPPPQTQLLDPDPGEGDNWKPDKMPYRSALRLRAGLSKAPSSILTQVRTGKIGLAAFICKQRVPDFPTLACSCGAQWETARHVVMDCPRLQHACCSLFTAASTTDYQVMISRQRPAATLTAWILRHGVLPQFPWAQEQLAAGY